MVNNRVFGAAGDKNHGVDTGCRSFFDRVLHQRLIDYRQHFFGHGLGGGQETGT